MSSIRDAIKRDSVLNYAGDETVISGAVRVERTDLQLIELTLAGEQTAFEQLFDRHKRLVARTAARYFRRPEEIEEVVQISFAKAFLELQTFRGLHSFSFPSWIGRIAANTCLDLIRNQKRKPEDLHCELNEDDSKNLLELSASVDAGQEDHLVNRDLAEKLLSRLSFEDRALLQMIYIDEMSIAEIAEFFGWSVSKVKIKAWRARHSLRKVLRTYL